ncbi:MAG: ferritin family protein [Planctomycetota bacterium]
MTVTYSAFEVFEIAEQIERNGAKFYRAAAELASDSLVRGIFLQLAEWEIRHEKLFARMKRDNVGLSRQPGTAKAEELLPDPKAMAGLAVFTIGPVPGEELRGGRTVADILMTAVKKERDTIVFYKGLKDFISAGAEQDKIDEIIKEEMRHVTILERLLNKTD